MAAGNKARPYHHGDLRDAILTRAAEIIGERGIEALSLRAIARDLGVSHGAPNRHFRSKAELLAALATEAWQAARTATLAAAEKHSSENPHVRLNALGRGFLRWAMNNPALFTALLHPDVNRYADDSLRIAQLEFEQIIHEVVVETQADGRYSGTDSNVLTLYTNAVPYGIAALLRTPLALSGSGKINQDELIAELMELVVPIRHPGDERQ